jgi:putative transcriptional regulator
MWIECIIEVMELLLNRFREIIDERGMKQKFIADKIGVSTTTISAIYNGQIPKLETALKIAKVLGLRVDEIWSLSEEEMP